MQFDGASATDRGQRYKVWVERFDDQPGGRVAAFKSRRLAQGCCDQINAVDLRYQAKVVRIIPKVELLGRVWLVKHFPHLYWFITSMCSRKEKW